MMDTFLVWRKIKQYRVREIMKHVSANIFCCSVHLLVVGYLDVLQCLQYFFWIIIIFNYNQDFSFFLLSKNSRLLTPLFGKVSNLGNFNKKALLKPRSDCSPVNEAKHTRWWRWGWQGVSWLMKPSIGQGKEKKDPSPLSSNLVVICRIQFSKIINYLHVPQTKHKTPKTVSLQYFW